MISLDRIFGMDWPRYDFKSPYLDSSHIYFAFFSSFFTLLLIIPFVTHTEAYRNDDIFQSSDSISRIKMVSYTAIGISFPLLVDGLLDLSIKNLLKRWIYWGMLSSIIIPSALNLVACIEDIPSLYVFSALVGLILRYMFLLANTLAAEFSSLIKLSILFIASIRVVLIFLWSIALFYQMEQSFDTACEILFFLCDLAMLLLLLSTFWFMKKDYNPANLCLKVSSAVLILLLTINVVMFCSTPSSVVTHLLETSRGSSINLLKACIMAVATLLPNRIYRASAEDLNRRYARKRDFVRYVSHEVRTPLNSIYVGLHILFRDMKAITSDPEMLSVIEDIKFSCNDAVNILDGILHFNEIDEGIAKIKPSTVRFKSFMSRLVNPFYNEATRTNVTINYVDDIDDTSNPLVVIIDKQKIGMVLRSLIASSLHMTPEHGTIEISLSVVSGSAGPPDDHQDGRPFIRLPNPTEDFLSDRSLMVRVTIKDTGAGIPKASLATIFDDSAQFRPIDYQQGLGTALDLWIAKEYVQMHEGNIGVVSSGAMGDGCIFYVDLKISSSPPDVEGSNSSSSDLLKIDSFEPLTTGEVKPIVEDSILSVDLPSNVADRTLSPNYTSDFSLPSLSPKAKSSSIPPNTQTNPPLPKHSLKIIPGDSLIEGIKLCRALVVDDVASNRKMLGRVIQSRFHHIDYAENGKIAVDLVQESESNEGATRYSVIFMDCNMPVMDGIEATKRIRALGFRGRMFGVTGNALGEDMDEFLSSGLDKVLTKPLNMEKLIQAMQDVENKPRDGLNTVASIRALEIDG